MPVVSKQKAEDAGEIQVGPPLNGNTLPRTLEIFHQHHETCSKRRKNGVSYEIRVETQRSDWLNRKYLDNLRQQQALQGPRPHLNSSSASDSEGGNMETVNNFKQSPGPQEKPAASHSDPHAQQESSATSNGAGSLQRGNSNSVPENGHNHFLGVNGHSSLDSLTIKREPRSAESTPPCSKSPPAASALPMNTTNATTRKESKRRSRTSPGPHSSGSNAANDSGMPEVKTKKRRLSMKTGRPHSLKVRSYSSPDDSEDDLKLKAEDCFSGVISTPLIKPLEEEDAPITTPSPPTSTASLTNRTSSSSVSSTPVAVGSASNNNRGSSSSSSACVSQEISAMTPGDSSLLRDLDEFSKVVDRVSKEESLRERRVTLQTNLYAGSRSPEMASQPLPPPQPHVLSPPPYPTAAIQQQQQPALTAHTTAHYYTTTQHTATMQRRPSIPESPYLSSVPQYAQPPNPAPLHSHSQMRPQVDHGMFVQPSIMQQQRPSEHSIQRHPQLQHLSVVSSQAQPSQPPLMSPTALTPISTHGPPFPDPTQCASSITVPVHTPSHPHTPTTPMEYFAGFPPPPHAHARIDNPQISPSHLPSHFPSTTSSMQSSIYPYGQNQSSVVRSPTVTAAGNIWSTPHVQQQGSLRDALLSKVNSHLDDIIGQRRPTQDCSLGYPLPPPRLTQSTTVMHPATSSMRSAHMQSSGQYPSLNYTGSNSSVMHTISYSAAYPHQM